MRRRQQLAERPAAHHVGPAGRIEPVGRVGLAALELQDGQRSLIAFDVLAHPAVEVRLIDRCRSSTGLVPENSSSFLTPSATMTLP